MLRLARRLVEYLQVMTLEINALTAEITERVTAVAPSLLAIVGCGPLTAAKILGETAQVRRFRSKDAFARLNGTAPVPVWSSNKQRHRLSRTGNRQLNAALHRIAMTQARMHPPAQELLARRKAGGDGGMEALRILKRRLSDLRTRSGSDLSGVAVICGFVRRWAETCALIGARRVQPWPMCAR